MLIAVIYGRIWKVLDDEVKRIDKYYRHFKEDGCTARSSLCLNFHGFWTPPSVLQAIRYRHWTVALSSTGYVLASIVIPVIQNYVYVWELYSGGSLAWPNSYLWAVAIAMPSWSLILTYLFIITFLCSLGLLILLPGRATGLIENPRGIASIHELVLGENHMSLQLSENVDRQTFSGLCSELSSVRFRLRRQTERGYMKLETVNPSTSSSQLLKILKTCIPFRNSIQRQWAKLKPALEVLRLCIDSISHVFITYPNFFLFRRFIFIAWLLLLLALLVFGIAIITIMDGNAQAELWNYSILLSPDTYVVIGVLVQVCHFLASTTDVQDQPQRKGLFVTLG